MVDRPGAQIEEGGLASTGSSWEGEYVARRGSSSSSSSYRLLLGRRAARRVWRERQRKKSGAKETESAEEGTVLRDGFTLRTIVCFSVL